MFILQVETAPRFISFGLHLLVHKSLVTVVCIIHLPTPPHSSHHPSWVSSSVNRANALVTHVIAVGLLPALLKGEDGL